MYTVWASAESFGTFPAVFIVPFNIVPVENEVVYLETDPILL